MQPKQRLSDISLTNRSTLVCDLRCWEDADSEAWITLTGAEDSVGTRLARLLEENSIQRLDDFGGVCETFLCKAGEYLARPPRTVSGAAVFSFTPKKLVFAEGSAMAHSARAAGYSLMVLTMQKDGKCGKLWVLCAALRHFTGASLTYYEDTSSIIDELKLSPEGSKILAVHVLTPEFSHVTSQHADRVVSQIQYRHEVLLSQGDRPCGLGG